LDSVSVRAKRGGEQTGPSPVGRGKAGSKYHVLVDRQGVPLAVQLSAANVHDSRLLEPLLDAVQPIRRPPGEPGRPRRQGVRLPSPPAGVAPSGHRAAHRAAWGGLERPAGTLQMGGGAYATKTEEREVHRVDQSEVCCNRDGGRSSGAALQGEVPNHPTLRRSRAGVVSSRGKAHHQCVRGEPRRRTQVNHR
jgi:hypothetical protein